MKDMNKKGMELTMNTIIIAVLSLVVLAVLIGLFVRQVGKTSGGYSDIYSNVTTQQEDVCSSLIKGTSCVTADKCPDPSKQKPGSWDDCQAPKVCCETF